MHRFKKIVGILSAVAVLPVYAQYPQGMTEEQMQQMMQSMMGMANCYQNIDQEKLDALSREAEAKHRELKALCAAGKRDKAQQEAITYGLKYMQSDEYKQIKACGEMAQGMMPKLPDYSVYHSKNDANASSRHVCDDL